jgi:hypothetical protein
MQKRLLLKTTIILLLFVIAAFVAKDRLKEQVPHYISNATFKKGSSPDKYLIAASRIKVAKDFVHKNKYSADRCFFIDMSLPSGSPRFFVYDLKKDTVINAGLVTHGNCNQYWLEGRQYGNTVGCGCTSLGKYKIGKSYYGKFGLAYKLHGLDNTNDKAFERFVVLHSHGCVPDNRQEDAICQSNGCPTVSPSFLNILQAGIDASEQPVLLWMYE